MQVYITPDIILYLAIQNGAGLNTVPSRCTFYSLLTVMRDWESWYQETIIITGGALQGSLLIKHWRNGTISTLHQYNNIYHSSVLFKHIWGEIMQPYVHSHNVNQWSHDLHKLHTIAKDLSCTHTETCSE